MAISKDEAAQALNEIESVRSRMHSMQRYRWAAPHVVLWGCIWALANTLVYALPEYASRSWGYLSLAGVVITLWLSWRSIRTAQGNAISALAQHPDRIHFWQIAATWLVIFGYFVTTFMLLPHLDGRQQNAFISMLWAFLYAFLGIYIGWRLFFIGIATALSILVGYFLTSSYYFLWMGLVSGSLLVMGGLWLRKV